MHCQLVDSQTNLVSIVSVLRQLRPQFSADELTEKITKLQAQGYQLAYAGIGNDVYCVAGFVIGEKLAWGKYLYIDDLVTDEKFRSTGAGTALLSWLKNYARDNQCEQLHLDSGVQRFAAHRFYLREGFNIASHHFSHML